RRFALSKTGLIGHDMTKRFCLLAIAVLAFTGISNTGPSLAQDNNELPELRLTDATVLGVDATALDVRIENRPAEEYPQVGHLSPLTFERALHAWAGKRFNLTGASVNTLRVTMRQGGIVEKLLPVKRGIIGWFKK